MKNEQKIEKRLSDDELLQIWKKFEQKFYTQNPEPLNRDSEEYKSWRNSFVAYVKKGLKELMGLKK